VRPLEARKPRLILEAQGPLGVAPGEPDQPISIPFFLSYSGSGLSRKRLALCQRTPRRDKLARMVSPVTLLWVMPSSKLTSAAICSVQRVLSEGTLFAKVPRTLVHDIPECLGPALVEGGVDLFGRRGAGSEGAQATLVEVVDGIAHRL
jgi:hypothetical protein